MDKNKKQQQTRLSRKQELMKEAQALAELNTKLRTKMRRLAIKIAG